MTNMEEYEDFEKLAKVLKKPVSVLIRDSQKIFRAIQNNDELTKWDKTND